MQGFEIREGRALGSRLRLTVESPEDGELVDRAWAAIQVVFQDVDRAMSRFRDDSELTLLNRRLTSAVEPSVRSWGPASEALVPSRMLAAALALADRACRATGGRFDPRVLADLERLGAGGVAQGTGGVARGIRAGRRGPGAGPIVSRTPNRGPLRLLAPVDLGGLGKGLALRWAVRRAAPLLDGAPLLLDAGGDVASRGVPIGLQGRTGWSIAIEDPGDAAAPVATVELLPDQAIATSSVRIGRWSTVDGRSVHHLIDPLTGQPGGDGLRAVTVAWPDPAWAEVWSKALFLEGARGIAAVARRHALAAWWIDEAGELSMTPAARQQTTWVRAEATSAA